MTIRIAAATDHPTVRFAAEELRRYLERAAGEPAALLDGPPPEGPAILVGLARDLPGAPQPPLPEGADPHLDDAVSIDVAGAQGTIVGSSPRGALLAVYRFLHLLGLRWVRPGPAGEHVPRVDLARVRVSVAERPAYRHRGVCIEGAVSFEHVRDLVDWMPKVGMGAYFVQFREAFAFFDRWYSRRGRPDASDALTVEGARDLVARVAAELKRRDMLLHAVGHGWTCEPFGIAGLGWEYPAGPVPPEAVQYLALVGGRRELWEGVPLNTSLCYSNPEVRRRMVESAAGYASEHPEVDYLHFWLADGANNQCECPGCAGTRPSDFYAMMLNDLDRRLSELGLATRVVFLAYFDLLWPPERERLRNPGRFALMFAPITRTYSRPFATDLALPPLPPYVRNRLTFPQSIPENLAFLRAWQAWCGPDVDSFDFDYHLMWDHYRDPGYTQVAATLHHDIRLLRGLGLDGFVSCQVQRAFFPTGLPMAAMGWALWDPSRDEDELRRDYAAAAFGPEGGAAMDYLGRLSRLFDPPALRGERPGGEAAAAESLAQVAGLVESFAPAVERGARLGDACQARSWRILRAHGEVAAGLAGALRERALGHPDAARERWAALEARLWELEGELHPELDAYLLTRVCGGLFATA